MRDLQAVLFDKDGTLFDFQATWGGWSQGMIVELAAGDADRADRIAGVMGYDLARRRFRPDSLVVAATVAEVAEQLLPLLPGRDKDGLIALMDARAATAPQAEAAPLVPLLGGLRAAGLRLGVATNDSEAPARSHLQQAGVVHLFDFIAGFDSGHGAKPGPGQLQAFAAATGLPSGRIAMVGDSLHDLHAARAAGMQAVAVLTGLAGAEDLAPHADVVLDSIADLPRWIGI